jgi:hypothetical protein
MRAQSRCTGSPGAIGGSGVDEGGCASSSLAQTTAMAYGNGLRRSRAVSWTGLWSIWRKSAKVGARASGLVGETHQLSNKSSRRVGIFSFSLPHEHWLVGIVWARRVRMQPVKAWHPLASPNLLNSAIASAVTPANPAAAAHTIRPTEQCRCIHTSSSCTNTAGPHENKPRQSKQLARAAIAPVVLNPALPAPSHLRIQRQLCTPYAPPSSAVISTHHHHHVQTLQGRTKTSRGRANSSRVRQ